MRKFFVLVLIIFTYGSLSAKKTDPVFAPANIKSVMIKVAQWQLETPRHETADWTNAVLYTGLFATWETTKSQYIYDELMKMGKSQQWQPAPRWHFADDYAICQTYIDLYRIEKDPKMISPTIETMNKFINNPYPSKGIEKNKWWWCDALFMGPPVMVKLGVTLNDSAYLKYSDEYFKECYNLLYDKKQRLFSRDLNFIAKEDGSGKREQNGEPIFWSRGNGWVMGGLVRILKELPAGYPQCPFYENLFKEMSSRIVKLQQPDGFWRASLLDPESYNGGETSGTGLFCYAFTWGINNNLLDKSYLPYVKKSWEALSKTVGKSGRVGWVQPIGAAPSKEINPNSWEVYGTGAFLLAGSEVIKLK
ncbi:MAG: glycoside hydrolase family 88 protein [Paludibacteraceae bacterium]